MSALDWIILAAALSAAIGYGLWKSRGRHTAESFLVAGHQMRWHLICISIMATQASAITFLSLPGQAYMDGMRFVQFYLGLPLAMVVLSATAVPIFHRLKVLTAYEYLEDRFDARTRTLAALLFLVSRGLSAGVALYAPAVVLSVLLGWNIQLTILLVGGLVLFYTALGGSRAVAWSQSWQMLVITAGMAAAGFMVVHQLPRGVGFTDALHVAGGLGKLQVLDLKFDLRNRYTLWSGLVGGFFLQLSYFGTDQSQVQRYLGGQSVAQSRMGLLANGLLKVPMQFLIVLLGALVFAFYQFSPSPVVFNPVAAQQARTGPEGDRFRSLEEAYRVAGRERTSQVLAYLDAARGAQGSRTQAEAKARMQAAEARTRAIRAEALGVVQRTNPSASPSDTDYVFLSYVLHSLPPGLVGLVLAAVLSASMSSLSAQIHSLGTSSVVDLWRRYRRKGVAADEVWVSRIAILGWGLVAVAFAAFSNRLGSLIEAVNILGSLVYGPILGIFLVAFYFRSIRGGAAFYAALVAEGGVLACFFFTSLPFLWYTLVGCALVVGAALLFQAFRLSAGSPLSTLPSRSLP